MADPSSHVIDWNCSPLRRAALQPDELIRDTELALREAKAAAEIATAPSADSPRDEQRKIETLCGMQHALAAGQLELYYQPKIRLCDGAHQGFEALLRWNKPDGMVLSPGSFMAALEDPELSVEIGDFVIASLSIRPARIMAGVPFNNIAINLSPASFVILLWPIASCPPFPQPACVLTRSTSK